jgi:hypothetical protein
MLVSHKILIIVTIIIVQNARSLLPVTRRPATLRNLARRFLSEEAPKRNDVPKFQIKIEFGGKKKPDGKQKTPEEPGQPPPPVEVLPHSLFPQGKATRCHFRAGRGRMWPSQR